MISLEEMEEMTNICEEYCKNCPHPNRKEEGNCYFTYSLCYSIALYNAGYRKQSKRETEQK